MRYIFDLQQLEIQGISVAVNPGSGNVTFEDSSNGFPIFHSDCFGDLRGILGDEKAEQVMEKAAEEINGEIFHAKLSRARRKF